VQTTNPASFKNPHSFKNKLGRLIWRWAWAVCFRPTPPRLFGGWRRFLLRCFGAKLGNTWIHSSVEIWAPWLLTAGNDVFVDQKSNLYNAYGIEIGDRVVISQGVFLCTATHDYKKNDFPLMGRPIKVGNDTWIAAEAFVAPGVTVHNGGVVGARAMVIKDVAEWTVVGGNPAKYIKDRVIEKDSLGLPADVPAGDSAKAV
jgi:putative colanic acid biosynthesis acetyltransferase WcaF